MHSPSFRSRSFSLALVCAAAIGACGPEDAGDASSPRDARADAREAGRADAGGERASYLPWAEGNSWTYRVSDDGEVTEKVTVIGAEEEVGGSGPNANERAFRVTTRKGLDSTDETVSWQAALGERVVRYREQSFGRVTNALELEEHWLPAKLHVDSSDERTEPGAAWIEEYEETKALADGGTATATARDTWIVDGVDQEVTVPAGTFRAVVLQKSSGSGAVKTYWYVRGVGKVKETGGQTEELVSYQVAP